MHCDTDKLIRRQLFSPSESLDILRKSQEASTSLLPPKSIWDCKWKALRAVSLLTFDQTVQVRVSILTIKRKNDCSILFPKKRRMKELQRMPTFPRHRYSCACSCSDSTHYFAGTACTWRRTLVEWNTHTCAVTWSRNIRTLLFRKQWYGLIHAVICAWSTSGCTRRRSGRTCLKSKLKMAARIR